MSPLPYTEPVAKVAFYGLLVVFAILEQRVRLRSWRDDTGTRADRGSLLVVVATAGAGFGGAFLLASHLTGAAIGEARWVAFILGIGLMGSGIAIRQWAITVLGRSFTTDVRVREDQAVIDAGPYRWVRHPSYSGILLTCIGTGLALGNWLSLACLAVVPTLGLVYRIRVEERALLSGLGEPYRRFAADRARLIPGVW